MTDKAASMLFLGVDVSKRSYRVAFLPVGEPPVAPPWDSIVCRSYSPARAHFQHLEEEIARYAPATQPYAAVDHTGGYYVAPLIHFLRSIGCRVSLVPGASAKSLREKLLSEKTKTDDVDAKTLAYTLYLHHVLGSRLVTVRAGALDDDSAVALLQLSRLRRQLLLARIQASNRLNQLLSAVFPEGLAKHPKALLKVVSAYPTPRDVLGDPSLERADVSPRTKRSLVALAQDTVGVCSPGLRQSVQLWAWCYDVYKRLIAHVEQQINVGVHAHPYGPILFSFPGVKELTAAWFIGLIGNIGRWPDSRKLRKAFGIYGVTVQSGETSRVVRGRAGNRHGKIAAIQAAARAVRHGKEEPNDFSDCYQRHRKRGLRGMKALYKVASKLIDLVHYCLTNNEPYSYRRGRGGPTAPIDRSAGLEAPSSANPMPAARELPPPVVSLPFLLDGAYPVPNRAPDVRSKARREVNRDCEAQLLSQIARAPSVTQRALSKKLGISLGKTNGLLRDLIGEGLVQATQVGWRSWSYNLTSAGTLRKAELTRQHVHRVLDDYRALLTVFGPDAAGVSHAWESAAPAHAQGAHGEAGK